MIDSLNQALDLPLSPPPTLVDSLVRDDLSAGQKCERFVAFYLGESLYCISAGKVAEVTHAQTPTPLPHSASNLIGITAVRGEIIAVLDIRRILHENTDECPDKPKLIVLNTAEFEVQPGFFADRMHEVVMLADSDIEASRDLPGISGTSQIKGNRISIINPDTIAQSIAVNA